MVKLPEGLLGGVSKSEAYGISRSRGVDAAYLEYLRRTSPVQAELQAAHQEEIAMVIAGERRDTKDEISKITT